MRKQTRIAQNFIIDKLTNSIENVRTGDSFQTSVSLIAKADLTKVSKKSGWTFDWKYELRQPERDVYKLTIVNNQTIIQGLISLQIMSDHVYMHLLESAPFNRGQAKTYSGVPANLVAFACQLSFQRGHEGNLSFFSKTSLISHYEESLGAFHAGGRIMILNSQAALKLIEKYFKNI